MKYVWSIMNCMIILRDSLIFSILEKETLMYLLKASITQVLEIGIHFKRRLTFLFPFQILKKRQKCFSMSIFSNGITRNSSLDPYHNIHLTFWYDSVIFFYYNICIFYCVYSSFHLTYYILLIHMYEY